MGTPEIMSKEVIAGIREMYTSGDEWDDSGLMIELCDSHEELRRQGKLSLTKNERERLIQTLIYHQRMSSGKCYCGWREIGKSHAEHVVNAFEMG